MNRFSKIRQYSTLLQTAEKYSVPTYAKPSVILTKGKGAYLWDSNDNKYIDFRPALPSRLWATPTPKSQRSWPSSRRN